VEEKTAPRAEGIRSGLEVEAHRLTLALETQRGRSEAAAASREELLERHRVQPQARRVQPRQRVARDGLARSRRPADAAPSALAHLAPREQQPHPHPLRQNQLLAPPIEAQRRDLHDGTLRLALEDARQQLHEVRRGDPG
jgi:hypothetical protein